MLADFFSEHWNDEKGMPSGGVTDGTGLTISWQHGPLGQGPARREPNGCFVETVIAAAKDRLEYYQGTQFACGHNDAAIKALDIALHELNERTADRDRRQVEGTHKE